MIVRSFLPVSLSVAAVLIALVIAGPVISQETTQKISEKTTPSESSAKTSPSKDVETGNTAKAPEGSSPKQGNSQPGETVAEGPMTEELMGRIIMRLDSKAKNVGPSWQFHVEEVPLVLISDPRNNRMRIMTPVAQVSSLSAEDMTRVLQANFDTALDARYAVANGILWATFIHPFKALHQRQFIEGIGQTVNIAKTYGTTYSSGLLSFGGGDSRAIIQRELIDKLLKQGQDI